VRSSNATTASADCPPASQPVALPGSGSVLSVRASGLYRVPSVTVGLRACSPARPRHPASLPICVPSVERLPSTLSRRLLAETTWRFGYGWRHYPRREPFIPIDQTPAGHTSAALRAAAFLSVKNTLNHSENWNSRRSRCGSQTSQTRAPIRHRVCPYEVLRHRTCLYQFIRKTNNDI